MVNRRLEKCIHVLLRLVKDEGFERLVKLEKGKNTERINMIRTRHQSSLHLSYVHLNETDKTFTWEVMSEELYSDSSAHYFPTQVLTPLHRMQHMFM